MDYRGEVKVILHNTSDVDFQVSTGDRIAQMKLSYVPLIVWDPVQSAEDLSEDTDANLRGDSGFGSTGISDNTTSS